MTRSHKKADNSMVGKALGMMGIDFTGGDIIGGGGGGGGGA